MFVAKVREPPYVAESDRDADAGEEKVQLVAPTASRRVRHRHFRDLLLLRFPVLLFPQVHLNFLGLQIDRRHLGIHIDLDARRTYFLEVNDRERKQKKHCPLEKRTCHRTGNG